MVIKNQRIMVSCRAPSARRPVRKPTSEPTDDFSASCRGCPCRNSINKTITNGKIRMPKGGKINDPIRTPSVAPRSPCFEPPNRLTDKELAYKSANVKIIVNSIIVIQKNAVNSDELIKKWYIKKPAHTAVTLGKMGYTNATKLKKNKANITIHRIKSTSIISFKAGISSFL